MPGIKEQLEQLRQTEKDLKAQAKKFPVKISTPGYYKMHEDERGKSTATSIVTRIHADGAADMEVTLKGSPSSASIGDLIRHFKELERRMDSE